MPIIYAIVLYIIAQALAWFQINGQFTSAWCARNTIILSFIGVPISYCFIIATKLLYDAMDGKVWPGRILTFCIGILVFTLLSSIILNDHLSWKIYVSLALSFIIIALQLL